MNYVLATNLYTFAQQSQGFFAWPEEHGEADYIRQMSVGDIIVPKFAQSAAYGGEEDEARQAEYCAHIETDYEEVRSRYEEVVRGGEASVPFLLRVSSPPSDRLLGPDGRVWPSVAVERIDLPRPLSRKEFLLLRGLPSTVAQQFKGAVATGRHLQEVDKSVVRAIREADQLTPDELFLRLSVVEASLADLAQARLGAVGRPPLPGDKAFVVSHGAMAGLHVANGAGQLEPLGQPIPRSPEDVLSLLMDARLRAVPDDNANFANAVRAATEITALLDGPDTVLPIDDFARFHDRYVLLPQKIAQAIPIAQRPVPLQPVPLAEAPTEYGADEESAEERLDVVSLEGLTVEDVERELPGSMRIPRAVLRECVVALRSGKHVLLGGPPGTGKSTLATALCRAVVGNNFDLSTATADWTTFDTIGGYLPQADGTLDFSPGVVLRALRTRRWLIIDELNRADIDKAFGPLFTLLAGSRGQTRVTLPYTQGGHPVTLEAGDETGSGTQYVMPSTWRLVGTLNLADKASLFQLSFAFLRRFAVIDVPVPDRTEYEALFSDWTAELEEEVVRLLSPAAMALAFGPRPVGPAVLADVAQFLLQALTPAASGKALYEDPMEALLVAARLYVVPQYEGSLEAEGAALTTALAQELPAAPVAALEQLSEALRDVSLR